MIRLECKESYNDKRKRRAVLKGEIIEIKSIERVKELIKGKAVEIVYIERMS
jgi:hypothetical protein